MTHLFQKNPLLDAHGQTGRLMVQLARQARAGWWLFGTTAVVVLVFAFMHWLIPRPVLVVDHAGRIVGEVTWRTPTVSNRVVLRDCMQFASSFLSLNSATVFSDYAHALNAMTPQLRHRVLQHLRSSQYLAAARAAHAVSWVHFSRQAGKLRVLKRTAHHAVVRLSGTIIIVKADGRHTEPFDLLLEVTLMSPSTRNRSGVEIASVHTR